MNWAEYFEEDVRRVKSLQKQIDQRKVLARTTVNELAQILAQHFDVSKVILTGSLLTDRFSMDSDIDLAVEGLRPDWYFKALSAMTHPDHPFSIDLIDLDQDNAYTRKLAGEGEVLYERRKG